MRGNVDGEPFKTQLALERQCLREKFPMNPSKHDVAEPVAARSIVIERLQRNYEILKSNASIAYVYCDYKDQVQQTFENIIASLLRQLVQNPTRMPLSKEVEALYDAHVRDSTTPSLSSLYNTLKSEIRRDKQVFVIIDALDECLENTGSRARLIRMVADLTPEIKLFVTSRPHLNLVDHLPNVRRLDVLASDGDIRKFVQERLSDINIELGRIVEGKSAFQKEIVDTVIAKARGM